jgi:DNA-binding HxlR family transcriptional regulator
MEPDEALSAAADLVGDRWVLRALALLADGPRTFGEMEQALGVATNVLSGRLKRLERDGLVVATPYQQRPVRFLYALTEKGRSLQDVLRQLAGWAVRNDLTSLAPAHDVCGTPLEVVWFCPTCRAVIGDDQAGHVHL